MKKLFSITMLAVFSIGAMADNETTILYDWAYNTTGSNIGVKVISGGSTSGTVTIPDTMWEHPVVEIAENAFQNNVYITDVKLPSTLTTIGAYAFESCTALKTVDFGKSLITIGERAFSLDYNLTAIDLPNTVTAIGGYAFWNCTSMTTARLGNSLATIGSYAFQYCKELTSISLPNTLTSVGEHFLCACGKLTTLVIPENLTTIGEYFLHGCENLKTVYLMGNKQRTLGNYPFMSQEQQHLAQVTDCNFYVESEEVYNNFYRNATNWNYADADNTTALSDDGHYQNGGNRYVWTKLPDDIREFETHWITACYPTDLDAGNVFGDNAQVAIMSNATYLGKDSHGDHLYHIDFDIVADKKMKAHTPYLLKADPKNSGSAFIVTHTPDEGTKTDEDLSFSVPIDNQVADPSASETRIKMLGTYTTGGRNLLPGEFLFANNNGNMKFYKQIADGKQRHMGAYRCYWQVLKEGTPVANAKMGAWADQATNIKTEIFVRHADHTEVYNLRGQVVAPHADALRSLPAGIYIINGKKTIIK